MLDLEYLNIREELSQNKQKYSLIKELIKYKDFIYKHEEKTVLDFLLMLNIENNCHYESEAYSQI